MEMTLSGETQKAQFDELDTRLRKFVSLEEYLCKNPPVETTEIYSGIDKETLQNLLNNYDPLKYPNVNLSVPGGSDNFLLSNINGDFSINQQLRFISCPFHRHSFIEMIYVYDGECRQSVGTRDNELVLKKGEICILNSNVVHAVSAPGEYDIIINCIMPQEFFDSTFLKLLSSNDVITEFLINSIFEEKAKSEYILFKSALNKRVSEIMRLILGEHYEMDSYSPGVIKSYLVALFTELLRVYRKSNGDNYPEDIIDNTVSRILSYIELNLKNINLSEAAQHFHFNPNYLGRLIKQKTNRNFSEIVQDERLKKASLLLEKSNLPVNVISEEIGYKNPNQLYKIFKEKYGSTPYEYRKKHAYI